MACLATLTNQVELLTSSPILASILLHFSLGQIDKILG